MARASLILFRPPGNARAIRLACTATVLLLIAGCSVLPVHDAERRPNTVFVLGSIHGYMLKHPHYTLPVFVAAIERFRPDVILTEVRVDHPGPLEGGIDGGIEQALVYAMDDLRGYEVVPADWFDDAFVAGMMKSDQVHRPEIEVALASVQAQYQEIIGGGSFEAMQDANTQALVRKLYELEESDGAGLMTNRNERICQNIVGQLAKLHGKRILVVFGLDHKYFLDDCVRRHGDQVVAPPDVSGSPPMPKDVRDRGMSYVRDSKAMLQARLAGGYYSTTMAKRLTDKLAAFDRWISKLNSE